MNVVTDQPVCESVDTRVRCLVTLCGFVREKIVNRVHDLNAECASELHEQDLRRPFSIRQRQELNMQNIRPLENEPQGEQQEVQEILCALQRTPHTAEALGQPAGEIQNERIPLYSYAIKEKFIVAITDGPEHRVQLTRGLKLRT